MLEYGLGYFPQAFPGDLMKKQPKKLALAKETVLALDEVQIEAVAGGATTICTATCGGSRNTCNTSLC
jgi:hypothetical protein